MTSPQPSYNLIGNFTHRTEPGHSGLIASPRSRTHLPPGSKLSGGGVFSHALPPFFFKTDNVVQFTSPVRVLSKQNMEKSVASVCNTKLPNAEIEKARQIHANLIVRLMVSPGDSAGAMWRAEQAFGLSYHCQKNLRYQHRASAEFVARLYAAWASVMEAGIRKDVELLRTEAAE